MLMNQPLFLCFYIPISGLSCKSQLNRLKLMISNSLQLFWAYLKLGGNFILAASTAGIETILSWFLNFMVWRFWIESICLLLYMAELFALCICAPICLQVLCVLNVHYLCFLPSPSGSDPEWSSNDEPGPLSRNPTPSHQPYCQQDSHCQVSPVPPVSADSLHDWQVYQPIRIMLTLQYFGSYLISPFDSVKSDYFLLEQNSQVIHWHQHTILFRLRPRSCMHDVTWIIDHTLSFFNGMTEHSDRLSCCETFISLGLRKGPPLRYCMLVSVHCKPYTYVPSTKRKRA